MLRQIFQGVASVALVVTFFGFMETRIAPQQVQAAATLPPGCYTDSSGLPVCGPNWSPLPGGVSGAIVSGTCTSPSPVASPTGGVAVNFITPCPLLTPAPTPSPSATSTSTAGPPSCVWAGAWPYTLDCFFPSVAQATPSPSATSTSTAGPPSCTWSGSFPYTINCNFPVAPTPSPTASAQGCGTLSVSGSYPYSINLNTSSCGGSTPGPSVMTKSTAQPWDSAVCGSEASVTHCYPLNGTGTTCLQDIATATSVPSPVPLATPTGSPVIVCGAGTISNDGETSVFFPFQASSVANFLLVAASAWPASGNFSLEWVDKSNDEFFTGGATAVNFVANDNTGNFAIGLYENGSSTGYAFSHYVHSSSSTHSTSIDRIANGVAELDDYTYDGTTIRFYVNCVLVYSVVATPYYNDGNAGYIGGFPSSDSAAGRMAKFAIANAAFSQTQCLNHLAALGY